MSAIVRNAIRSVQNAQELTKIPQIGKKTTKKRRLYKQKLFTCGYGAKRSNA